MTPHGFIAKWQGQKRNEKQGFQQHFLGLCDLVGHNKPVDVDKTAASFCFEGRAMKTGA
jgi:hypothetical protein